MLGLDLAFCFVPVLSSALRLDGGSARVVTPVLVLFVLSNTLHIAYTALLFCDLIYLIGITASNPSDFRQLEIKHKGRADTVYGSQMGPSSTILVSSKSITDGNVPHSHL